MRILIFALILTALPVSLTWGQSVDTSYTISYAGADSFCVDVKYSYSTESRDTMYYVPSLNLSSNSRYDSVMHWEWIPAIKTRISLDSTRTERFCYPMLSWKVYIKIDTLRGWYPSRDVWNGHDDLSKPTIIWDDSTGRVMDSDTSDITWND